MKNKNILIALILIIGIAISCNQETTDKQQCETIVVKRRTLSSTVLATGVIEPEVGAEVRVGSRVSGVVKKLNINVGDSVRKGDMLACLDQSELMAQYNQTKAYLENAETTLKFAQIEKDRLESLLKKDFTSAQSYDLAVKNYEIAKAQVAQVSANLDYAKIQLDYTKIIAPISGVVASVTTQEGETVAAMFAAPTFLTIIDLNRLEVKAYVDETDISKVSIGQKAEFTVDTYTGIAFEGIVKAIYPKAEIKDNVVNYIVIIEITDSKDKILRPEMTVTINIHNESFENIIAIPNKAITHKEGDNYVYVFKDGNQVERKIITGVKDKSFTQIINGLTENEKIILSK